MTSHLHRRAVRAAVASSVVVTTLALTTHVAGAAPTPIPVGTPPKAVITVPRVVYAGIPITLSGANSSAPGDVSEWEWDLSGGRSYEESSTSTPWVSKAFTAGKHTVRLRVRGGNGLVATTSKTFTAKRPPAAVSEPDAPASVTAQADGTSVDVVWVAPLGPDPLVYRVSNVDDADTDPIYVPATEPLEASFDDLVPGTYRIRVVALNGDGGGPAAVTEVEVLRKGASSASPSATPTTTATDPAVPADPTTSAGPGSGSNPSASSGDGMDNDTIGIVLISVGGVVLLGAALAGAAAGWRRRRSG